MNREFEILNEKLNIIFEELINLRGAFLHDANKREIKELEYKVKDAKHELEYQKDNHRFENKYLDDRRNWFMDTNNRFHKDMQVEECEKAM